MQYHVRMMSVITWFNRDTGKDVSNTKFHYLPAFDKTDAQAMVKRQFNVTATGRDSQGNRINRTFDVVASVWTGKGSVYLDLTALEQIAEEYTAPQLAAE